MTDQPPTEQQLDEIETRAAAGSWGVYEYGNDGSVTDITAEVRRLRDRITELEGPAVEARAALAALCYDLEDPGTAALGALHLISRVTAGVEAPRDEAAQALARHDAQIMRRCAEFVRDTYDGEWVDDAAATLERDADIAERGCPGFEAAYQGPIEAERRLGNCKHCGRAHPELAASVPPGAPVRPSQPSGVSESAQSPTGAATGRLGDLPSTEDLASADNPTHLRWGLGDVQWGDDDSVIVMLSGPDREAYWLELDPERAGVLREDLAGPDGESTTPPRQTLTPNEYDAAWHAVEGSAGEEGADPGTVLHAVLDRLGIQWQDAAQPAATSTTAR